MSPRPSRWNDVVTAAAEEFREKGYERATIDGISQRVGILKGSVYNYIDTKEDLLLAVIDEPARELMNEALRLARAEGSAHSRLRQLFRAQVSTFARTYPAAFVYLSQMGSHPEKYQRMNARYLKAVERIIEQGMQRGEFQVPIPASTASRAVLGMLGWMQHWFVPRDEEQTAELADQLFTLAIAGLADGEPVISKGAG